MNPRRAPPNSWEATSFWSLAYQNSRGLLGSAENHHVPMMVDPCGFSVFQIYLLPGPTWLWLEFCWKSIPRLADHRLSVCLVDTSASSTEKQDASSGVFQFLWWSGCISNFKFSTHHNCSAWFHLIRYIYIYISILVYIYTLYIHHHLMLKNITTTELILNCFTPWFSFLWHFFGRFGLGRGYRNMEFMGWIWKQQSLNHTTNKWYKKRIIVDYG